MYKDKPWTLDESKKEKKSPYIKNRESDLAVSTVKVRKLFEENINSTFSNNEIAKTLGISLGTVSDITNRLEAIQDIKIVKVRQLKSALSQVFQHRDGPLAVVVKERGKSDAVINVLSQFMNNPNKVFTKKDLKEVVDNTESKIRRSLQILLTNGSIKLVGQSDGCAEYQYYKGNKKGIAILYEEDENYSSIQVYIKKRGLRLRTEEVLKEIDSSKNRLFYSSKGLIKEYPVIEIEKAITKILNKYVKYGRN